MGLESSDKRKTGRRASKLRGLQGIKIMSSLLILTVCIGLYLYFIHTGQIRAVVESIRDLGLPGILIGILIQSAANVVPVPGEFISLVLMEIYGPVMGGVYSWISGVIGALGGYYAAKWIAKPFFEAKTRPVLEKADRFIRKRGAIGMLLIRFAPIIPYHLVNYTAGILNVKPITFLWTTGLGNIPYTVAMSGIYAGVRHGTLVWGVVGVGIFALLLAVSLSMRRKKLF